MGNQLIQIDKRRLIPLQSAVDAALKVAHARGERAFIVGGFVRDLVMHRKIGDYDLDLVIEGDGLSFSRDLNHEIGGERREHVSFLTAKLFAPFHDLAGAAPLLSEVDIATARSEDYQKPGALPSVNPTTIARDLWRRDFSTNAMALPLSAYRDLMLGTVSQAQLVDHVIDPCGGLADINGRFVRILHPRSFTDDPTRLFRAVRYLVRLSFTLERETFGGFYAAVRGGALATLSPRRVWNEVIAALGEEHPAEVLREFVERGLLSELPIIGAEEADQAIEALAAAAGKRNLVSANEFIDCGKLVLLALLVQGGREDIAQAISEGSRMIKRAKAVLKGERLQQLPGGDADILARYALWRDEACLRELCGEGAK